MAKQIIEEKKTIVEVTITPKKQAKSSGSSGGKTVTCHMCDGKGVVPAAWYQGAGRRKK